MRKILCLTLAFILGITLLGCEAVFEPDELMLDGILTISKEKLEHVLIGQARDKILERWGEPDGSLSNLHADIFLIPYSDQMILVYYNDDSIVTAVKIEERKK